MASSCLAVNSFLLSVGYPAKSNLFRRSRGFAVVGKTGSPLEDGGGNSKPFQLNFGMFSDVKTLIPVVSERSPGLVLGGRRKDPGTVFVAGADGQVGARIVQALLRQGFKVRAGVSDLDAAQELARFANLYKVISDEESRRLNAVESTFDEAESIAKSIGNASKVVVTISPTENGPAAQVTTSDALQVMKAAQLAGVSHITIIYDDSALATSTYKVIDGISSFFNKLFKKSQPLTLPDFLDQLIQTDFTYTFIKTMLVDDFMPESSYNVVVAAEGAKGANDYKVSKSRMATIVADLLSNTVVAENKVVEVFTRPEGPRKTIDELFSAIPVDGRRQAYAVAKAKAEAEEKAAKAQEMSREAAEAAKKLSDQQSSASFAAEEDENQQVEPVRVSAEGLSQKPKELSSWDKFRSVVQNAADIELPKVQVATVRGKAKARTLPPQKAVTKQPTVRKPPPLKKPKDESKPKLMEIKEKEVRNILGGLFKQETIYIDED